MLIVLTKGAKFIMLAATQTSMRPYFKALPQETVRMTSLQVSTISMLGVAGDDVSRVVEPRHREEQAGGVLSSRGDHYGRANLGGLTLKFQ